VSTGLRRRKILGSPIRIYLVPFWSFSLHRADLVHGGHGGRGGITRDISQMAGLARTTHDGLADIGLFR
jgi:hypothetical protein